MPYHLPLVMCCRGRFISSRRVTNRLGPGCQPSSTSWMNIAIFSI